MVLKEKSAAPLFTLPDETGKNRSLADFLGKDIVLYFYPKDETAGCTTEACNFRDDYSAYEKAGVILIGVSPDSPASHAKFKEHHQLPFTLLADEDHKVCALYGACGKKQMYGREYDGVLRTTFLIGKEGKITKVFENVKPADHSAEILASIM